jgi:hypothetical protein
LVHIACYIPQLDLCSLKPFATPTVKLAVIMDPHFKLEKQIESVLKSSSFQLRLLSKVKSFIKLNDFESLYMLSISP